MPTLVCEPKRSWQSVAISRAFRNHWREPGDLVKVFQRTQDGEEFIGRAEFDPRERIVLWYPSGV